MEADTTMSNHTPVSRFRQFVNRIASIDAAVLALVLSALSGGIFVVLAATTSSHDSLILSVTYAAVACVFLIVGISELRHALRKLAAPRIAPAEWAAREFPPVSLPDTDGEYLYLVQDAEITHMVKIGRARNLRKRIGRFMVVLPIRVHCIHYMTCDSAFWAERALHEMFADKRGAGEWFKLTDLDIETLQAILHMGELCVVRTSQS